MTGDEANNLRTGDVVSYRSNRDGRVATFRAQLDMADTGSRFIRVQWLTSDCGYDVIDRRSPIWLNMVKR